MRPIKFRAWDKTEKKFFEPTYETYKGQLEDLSITFAGEILRRTLQEPAEHESCFPDRYELSQFTGLKDKNGKEIYHKDICEFNNGDKFVVDMEDYLEFFVHWIDDPECEDQARDLYRIENSKVIGNIYENPELLKK